MATITLGSLMEKETCVTVSFEAEGRSAVAMHFYLSQFQTMTLDSEPLEAVTMFFSF